MGEGDNPLKYPSTDKARRSCVLVSSFFVRVFIIHDSCHSNRPQYQFCQLTDSNLNLATDAGNPLLSFATLLLHR